MTERNKNIQTEKSPGAVDQAKIESVKKADAAVKSMSDFTSPEVLYQELITSVKIPSVYGYFHDTESLRGSKRGS